MNEQNILVVADDQVYRVEMHEKASLMHVFWKCHVEGEVLKEKFQKLLELIVVFKPTRWLGNAKATHYITMQDARWLLLHFFPSLICSSVSKYARLESTASLLVLDSMSLQDKINSLPENSAEAFEFRFFTDEDQAHQWLAI